MKKPSLNKIIEDNKDKTSHIPNPVGSRIPNKNNDNPFIKIVNSDASFKRGGQFQYGGEPCYDMNGNRIPCSPEIQRLQNKKSRLNKLDPGFDKLPSSSYNSNNDRGFDVVVPGYNPNNDPGFFISDSSYKPNIGRPFQKGGTTGPNQPYHPITNPDGYKQTVSPLTIIANAQKLPVKQPYQPSQMVNNAKAILAGADVSTGFSGNPYVAGANYLARIANSAGDAYTAGRYAMDGQWDNASVDAGEALLDLIPFRKGKKVVNLSKTNNLPAVYNKMSKLDKALNRGLKVGKAGATTDDFMHSSLGKFLFGDPDSQLIQNKFGGGYFPEYHSYAPPRMDEGGTPCPIGYIKNAKGECEPINKPTRRDSIDVLNNTNALLKYYNKDKYKPYYDPSKNNFRTPIKNPVYFNDAEFKKELEDFNSRLNNGLVYVPGKNSSETAIPGKNVPSDVYYKPVDKNKYYRRESENRILDTRAPMQLIDKRIKPHSSMHLWNYNTDDMMYDDGVRINLYEPLAVTPWDMLKPNEQKLRLKKYGVTGTPYDNPNYSSEPALNKQVTHMDPISVGSMTTPGLRPIQNPNIQMSGAVPQGNWNVEYFDPESKKTETKHFITNKQAEQFYNDPANRASRKYSNASSVGRMQKGGISFLPEQDPEMMYTDRFNTVLTEEEQKEFNDWVAKESERRGKNILMDKGAYDVQGFWKSGDYNRMVKGHGTDTWKKPNHPTFSNQSKYHGVDGFYGGNWKPDGGYQPSKQSADMYGPGYYNRMFAEEPGRIEHLDASRYMSGANRPSPLYYKNGGWLENYMPKAQLGFEQITGIKPITSLTNRTDAPGLSIQEKQRQDAAALEMQRRNDATAKRQFVGKGKASTKESEARRVMLNAQNTAGLPNVQMDQFGNTSAINPNMTYTGEPANFMGERQQKGLEHVMGALEAAGYLTGAGELAGAGYNALKPMIAESMESKLLSPTADQYYRKALQQKNLQEQTSSLLSKTGVEDPTHGGLYQAPKFPGKYSVEDGDLVFRHPTFGDEIASIDPADYSNFKTPELYKQALGDLNEQNRYYLKKLIDQRNANIGQAKQLGIFGKQAGYDPRLFGKKNLIGGKKFPGLDIPDYLDNLGADMPMYYRDPYGGIHNVSGLENPEQMIPYKGLKVTKGLSPNKYGGLVKAQIGITVPKITQASDNTSTDLRSRVKGKINAEDNQYNKLGKDIEEGEKFMTDYYNSPMFQKLYNASVASDKAMASTPKPLHSDLSDIVYSHHDVVGDDPNIGGQAYLGKKWGPHIEVKNEQLFSKFPHTVVHEQSHWLDNLGESIPETDIQLMKKYYNTDQGDGLTGFFASNDFKKYVADPTETLARLRTAKYLGKKQGIYDPFTQKINMDQYKKIRSTSGLDGYNPLDQLELIYSPEQIIDMMNKIAKNKGQNSDVAKYGGLVKAANGMVTGDPNQPYNPLTNPNGYKPTNPLSGALAIAKKREQENASVASGQAQLKQAKGYDTQADVERRKSFSRSYVGTNQNAAVNTQGYVVPKHADTDLQGNVIDAQANRQRRMLGVVGGLTAPLVGAATVMGAGAAGAGLDAAGTAVYNMAAANPTIQAIGAGMNTAPSWAPGLTGSNILSAGFGYQGAKNVPNVMNAWKNVGSNPTLSNIGNATGETLTTALDMAPFVGSAIKGVPNLFRNATNASTSDAVGAIGSKLGSLKNKFNSGLDNAINYVEDEVIYPIKYARSNYKMNKLFKQLPSYFNSPEVVARLEKLGIPADEIKNLQFPTFTSQPGFVSSYTGDINHINVDMNEVSGLKDMGLNAENVFDHEVGHWLQREIHRLSPEYKTAQQQYALDLKGFNKDLSEWEKRKISLENLPASVPDYKKMKLLWEHTARKPFQPLQPHAWSKPTYIDEAAVNNLSSLPEATVKAKPGALENLDYFVGGGKGYPNEPVPHLRETKRSMIQSGFLKGHSSDATEKAIQDYFNSGKSSNDRIGSFIDKNDPQNIRLLQKLFNSIPALAPVGLGAGLMYQQGSSQGQQYKRGGMITDPKGQWAHPGQNTRIPGNNITMQGVPYPVLAKANNGMTTMMYPGQEYHFPGADHVDEYPQMQLGGFFLKAKEAVNNGKQFISDWTNSPMHKQMLTDSVNIDDPVGRNSSWVEDITDARNAFIDNAKPRVAPNSVVDKNKGIGASKNLIEPTRTAGFSRSDISIPNHFLHGLQIVPASLLNGIKSPYPNSYQRPGNKNTIYYKPELEQYPNELKGVVSHEVSHASDMGGLLIPQADIDKMKKYASVSDEFSKYVAEPTETRARLNSLRMYAKDQKLYDPFTQKATKDVLDKYKNTNEGNNLDPLQQLRGVYSDDEILDMLNSVSKAEPMQPTNTDMAKYGGLHKAQDGLEYTGPSIVDYLATKGYSGKKSFRKEVAQKYGVENYDFSADKNLELLAKIRENDDMLEQNFKPTQTPIPIEKMLEMEKQKTVYKTVPKVQYDKNTMQPKIVQTPVKVKQPTVDPGALNAMLNIASMNFTPTTSPNRKFLQNSMSWRPSAPTPDVQQPVAQEQPTTTIPQGINPVVLNMMLSTQRPANQPKIATIPNNPFGSITGGDGSRIAPQPVVAPQAPVYTDNGFRAPYVQPVQQEQPLINQMFTGMVPPAVPAKQTAPKKAAPKKKEISFLEHPMDWFADALNKTGYDWSNITASPAGVTPQGAINMTNDLTDRIMSGIEPLIEKISPQTAYKIGSHLHRQELKNDDNLKETKTKFTIPVAEKVDDKLQPIITGDTIRLPYNRKNPSSIKDRYIIPGQVDLTQTEWGIRNRGDFKPIETQGGDITLFEDFVPAKTYFKNNPGSKETDSFVGVNDKGRVVVGTKKDFINTNIPISHTFSNKIVDFDKDANGKLQLHQADPKASAKHLVPTTTMIDDKGKIVKGGINFLVPKGNKDTKSFGEITGGRIIFASPDGKDVRVAIGSPEDVAAVFYDMKKKGNYPYITAYTNDNGVYGPGLRKTDGKITTEDLKKYQGSNTTGSVFLYLKGKPAAVKKTNEETKPVLKYKDVQASTPNIRTEKDESYKKGHPLVNEQSAIILHHTGYSDTTGISQGQSKAMKGVMDQFSRPGESSHVVIDFNGTRYNYARPDQVTFHAGKSVMNGRENVNDFGIGIEFQGDTDNKPLTDAQIESFVEYIAPIIKDKRIPLENIITHKQIRSDYMKAHPEDKQVLGKPDVNERDYNRIKQALIKKGIYQEAIKKKKLGGSVNIGDEMDVTEEQLEQLKKQGYKFNII